MQDNVAQADETSIRAELDRVLGSAEFAGSERHRRFLTYIVEETLAGRGDRLKAYNIATAAFNRDEDFDPQQDSIVRIEAGRLRRALDHFYLTDGRNHQIQIVVPKGSYVPQFRPVGDTAQQNPQAPGPAIHRGRAPRILVMPLEQEGENNAVPGFAQGVTRQIIAGLTRFYNVHVYGAETSEEMGSRLRADQPARQLVVDFVLSGAVSLGKDSFAIDLLLQEAASRRYVWTERFVRKLDPDSIHSLRDEVAAIVAHKLAQPLGILFHQALDDAGDSPGTLGGYRAVLDFYKYTHGFRTDQLEPVRRRLEEAVQLDPTFAEGHACLSHLYSQHTRFMRGTPSEMQNYSERAFLHARQALLLAPSSSKAHHALALAYWFSGDTVRSLESYKTARALNPADADLMADMGLRHCLLQDWEAGVPLIEESYRRNPCQSSTYRVALVLCHFAQGQYEQAMRQALLLDAPDVVYHHMVIGACAQRLGLHEKAQEAVASIEKIEPDYAQRVASDLAARNVHPALAQDVIAALREAGLGRRLPAAGARSSRGRGTPGYRFNCDLHARAGGGPSPAAMLIWQLAAATDSHGRRAMLRHTGPAVAARDLRAAVAGISAAGEVSQ